MKICIYCDSLIGKGGAQKVVIQLANALHADIITSGFSLQTEKWLPIEGKVIDIGNITQKYSPAISFFFETPIRFLFYKNNEYDMQIFFGVSCIFSARKNKNNIWFCFTLNRVMYDLKEWKLSHSSLIKKLFFKLHILLFNVFDQKIIKNNFTTIIAQTKTVKKRIKRYYGLNSEIIYSPIDTSQFKFIDYGSYFLAVSRLMPEKRIDVIVKAFIKLKNRKLIIVGDGSERLNIQNMIKGHKNITLYPNISEKELIELYAKCYAVIYLPVNEDFGIVPLEAMASGKICIAANEGGCKETVIHKKTGYLIDTTEENLIKVIQSLKKETMYKMKKDCLVQAENFDITKCIRLWKEVINYG